MGCFLSKYCRKGNSTGVCFSLKEKTTTTNGGQIKHTWRALCNRFFKLYLDMSFEKYRIGKWKVLRHEYVGFQPHPLPWVTKSPVLLIHRVTSPRPLFHLPQLRKVCTVNWGIQRRTMTNFIRTPTGMPTDSPTRNLRHGLVTSASQMSTLVTSTPLCPWEKRTARSEPSCLEIDWQPQLTSYNVQE